MKFLAKYSLFIASLLISVPSHANLNENFLFAECNQNGLRFEVHSRDADLSTVVEDTVVDVYQYESGKITEILTGTIDAKSGIELPAYWNEAYLDPSNCNYQKIKSSSPRIVRSKKSKKSTAIIKMEIIAHFLPMSIDPTEITHDEYLDLIADRTVLLFKAYVYCHTAASTASGPCMSIVMPDQQIYPL